MPFSFCLYGLPRGTSLYFLLLRSVQTYVWTSTVSTVAENLTATWSIRSLSMSKPKLHSVSFVLTPSLLRSLSGCVSSVDDSRLSSSANCPRSRVGIAMSFCFGLLILTSWNSARCFWNFCRLNFYACTPIPVQYTISFHGLDQPKVCTYEKTKFQEKSFKELAPELRLSSSSSAISSRTLMSVSDCAAGHWNASPLGPREVQAPSMSLSSHCTHSSVVSTCKEVFFVT